MQPHRDHQRYAKIDHTVWFTNAQLKDKDICHDEAGWKSQDEVISNPFEEPLLAGNALTHILK